MISTIDLYEAGFVSSEHTDIDEGINYIEFSKKIDQWTIDVTNEIDGDIVTKQYAELSISHCFNVINVTTIEEIKALEKMLNKTPEPTPVSPEQ